jgi:hypothetical protein
MRQRRDSEHATSTRHVMAGLVAVGVLGIAAMGLLASPAGARTGASAAATAQAHKALLVLADMPAGWTSTPSAKSSSTTVSGGFTGAPPSLATCLGVPRQIVEALPPEVNSAQMSNQGGTLQVQDTISIFPSTTFAQEEYAAVSSHKAPGCLRSLLNSALGTSGGSGTAADALSVARATSPEGTTALDLDTALTSQGTSQPIRQELILFVHGQLVDTLDLTGYGSSTLPPALVQHLTSLARSRL